MPSVEIRPDDLDLLCVGETLIDFISVDRVDALRQADVFRRHQGGSPANIAVNVAKLGGSAGLISKTGIGAFGQFLKAELDRAGVVTDYLVMDHRVHTSVIFVSRTVGTPDFEAFRHSDYLLEPQDIKRQAVERARVVHASSFALSREPCRSAVVRAFDMAQSMGKIVSLDPNYSPQIWPEFQEAHRVLSRVLAMATVTKPSLDDAERLFGEGQPPEDYIAQFHDLGPSLVILTMGAKGILLSESGTITHIRARPIHVVDATGAGDAFWAGFLVALLDGNTTYRSALFAREVVEHKLATVGPLPDTIDRSAIYGRMLSPEAPA